MSALLKKHQETLNKALAACATRESWTAYPESPSRKIHGEEVPQTAIHEYHSLLNNVFELDQPGIQTYIGDEICPYTEMPLGVSYPSCDIDVLFEASHRARQKWCSGSSEERMGVCLEMLHRLGSAESLFLNAHSTVHTAGQSFIMAFAGCGANALDRGLEALAYAHKAVSDVPLTARWNRHFGTAGETSLEKRFRLVPRGTAIVITCATFPQWNGYPAIVANILTGNSVILKPHPRTTLPVALFTRTMRAVLSDQGFDPNLITMAVDTTDEPITMQLVKHSDAAIIDFTGGPSFGRWLEQNCADKLVYTETAGCNSVVIESTDDYKGMCNAIAHSMCQASAQMCTSVQNIFLPKSGIETDLGHKSCCAVGEDLVSTVDRLLDTPKMASTLCGTLVDPKIYSTITKLTEAGHSRGRVLRESQRYENPEYPEARTATPLIIGVDAKEQDLYQQEHFGPISFLISVDDANQGLRRATEDTKEFGAITSHVYSTKFDFCQKAETAYHDAGASLSINLTGMPINFAAAYSDYHVSGLNPAGNACLADLAFVTNRFRIVQTRFPAGTLPKSQM